MRTKTLLISALLAVLVFSQALALQAQEKEKNFTGNFSFGYRAVDTSGAYEKYREHINLDTGVRLFNFNLTYLATDDLKTLFDRIDMNVTNFGGDPFETFRVSIQKYGTYKFQFDRKKSDYFYGDLYENGSGGLVDYHRLDFNRISDSAVFNLTLSKAINVYLNYDRYTKSGDSVVAFDINRLEAEADKPLSEKLSEVAIGLDLHVSRYGLVVEGRRQEYKNTNSFFVPGYVDGGPGATYPSALDHFRMDQPYDFTSNITSFRLNARPLDNLIFKGSARLSKQDTHLSYSEQASGIDYLDSSFMTDLSGMGKFKREIQLYDGDLTYLLFNKLAVIGGIRYSKFSQNGSLTVEGAAETVDFGFNTLGIEAGVQYQFSPKFTLTAGYRHEKRELTSPGSEDEEGESAEPVFETATYADATVRNGLFGNIKFDLKALKLTLDYQHGAYDDPYTLISPTMYDRFRATAKYQIKGFNVSATYLMSRTKNEIDGGVNFRVKYTDDNYSDLWKSSNDQFNLRLGYGVAKFSAALGYSLINFKSNTNRQVKYNPYWSGPGGTFLWKINYEGKSTLLDASVSYALNPNWKVGGYVNSYKNSGFWPIERTMFKGYVEYAFTGGFVSQLAYRWYDFKEKDGGYNNYKAGILEFSFGYCWE
jgi:hypothetical protein